MSLAEDKAALNKWEAHVKSILQHTEVSLSETVSEKEKRIKLLESDTVKWAKYYFPHYCTAEFADFHKEWIDAVNSSDRFFGALACARDHAKSVVTDIIEALFLTLTKQVKNTLIVSYNETNAIELLTPIKLELEVNQRILSDYGTQRSYSQWESGKIVTRSGASFRAIGRGQSPRGTRNQEARPELIICDDLDDDETCRSPKRLEEAWEWTIGALFGCFSITGKARFLIIGNIIAKDSLLVRAIKQADKVVRANILDESGKPTWQRFTLDQCQYMISKMGYRLSQREYFNNPVSEGKIFKKEFFQYKKMPPLRSYKFLIGYLDPSFSDKKNADTKSMWLLGLWQGELHLRKGFCAVASINTMVDWGYDLDKYCKKHNAAWKLYMEDVFFQSILYKDFNAAHDRHGYRLAVIGDKRKKPDKDARISAMEGFFSLGNFYIDEDIQGDFHVDNLIEQFLCFEPGVKTKKDGPDSIEGGKYILEGMVVSGGVSSGKKSYDQNNRL